MTEKSLDIYDVVCAIAFNIEYVKLRFVEFEINKQNLQRRFMVVGHGRAGKDETAIYLAKTLGLRYEGSTSLSIKPIITSGMYDNNRTELQELCYSTRHDNRKYWYDFANMLRQIDPLLLIKLTLSYSDILVGTRSFQELENGVQLFRPTDILWLDRNVPADPTLEFRSSDLSKYKYMSNIWNVDNNGSISELHEELDHIIIFQSSRYA